MILVWGFRFFGRRRSLVGLEPHVIRRRSLVIGVIIGGCLCAEKYRVRFEIFLKFKPASAACRGMSDPSFWKIFSPPLYTILRKTINFFNYLLIPQKISCSFFFCVKY